MIENILIFAAGVAVGFFLAALLRASVDVEIKPVVEDAMEYGDETE